MRPVRLILNKIRHSLRYKLLVLVLFPIVVVMPIALLLAIYWGSNFSYEQLYIKVNTDLSVSHDVFQRIQRDYLHALGKTGESYPFRTALASADSTEIQLQIRRLQQENAFSYIHLTDQNGTVIHPREDSGQAVSTRYSSAREAARAGIQSSGIEIFSAAELAVEHLAGPLKLPLITTPRAR
ncbi:MAG: hypothetical protein H8E21_10285 [Gammaproteobacteria bacterium]|nr:hypothetical protein [Gammaproteobacteria bacterium]MBL6998288.1 hypothetical protein [Gammaproteobacteria bacterium]